MSEIQILVVENHPTVSSMLSQCLQRLGHSVSRVGDFDGARERLSSESYDLVLADLDSPECDTGELDAMLPERCFLVTMSAFDGKPSGNRHHRCLGHLPKPFLTEDLVCLVRRAESAVSQKN